MNDKAERIIEMAESLAAKDGRPPAEDERTAT
jgi:hypothetical protein